MIAVLSDVHANLAALQAVLADAGARALARFFFLGDIVGYGPDPVAVVDLARQFEYCLLGNHDRAVVHGVPPDFNKIARAAAEWTREQLDPERLRLRALRPARYAEAQARWAFLRALKPGVILSEMMLVHDHPGDPGSDRYVNSLAAARECFAGHPGLRAFFVGHSHRPRILTPHESIIPEPGRKYSFPKDEPVLVNVGSVGQPRDGDPRACYCIVDDGYRFIRLPYDVEATAAKIKAAGLPESLAVRLRVGR
jgi:diadenosine tetraphosphatase ApaH/serine/threonine PP2A family protein phosphatase